MLTGAKNFFYERRKGLTKVAVIVGGAYAVRGYVQDRLEEVKERLEQDRMAKENLKRRFNQTQENISFTVLALIQTLSEQVHGEMHVEDLTLELQNRSKARHTNRQRLERPPSSLASSIDMVQDQDTRSEAGSAVISVASTSYDVAAPSISNISTSGLQSWVESSGTPLPETSQGAEVPARISDSIATVESSIHNGGSSSATGSAPSESLMSSSVVSEFGSSRTTAELWNEVKILTFTRTLTTLYSTTLLSLLTSIQLTLLARSKYIHSVLEMECEERMQEHMASQFTLTNILLNSGQGLEQLLSGDMSSLLDEDDSMEEGFISEDVENKFLTMSWWILHVGWKDVSERVRRGVEEAFDGVSLKSKLAAIDLHRLVSDVRRRVEYEITFEGRERRINFLSSLLPPTPETVHHVLTRGGSSSHSTLPAPYDLLEFDDISAASSQLSHSQHLPPHPHPPSILPPFHPRPQDPAFIALLEETREIITSSDFAHVLEACLDRATEVLFTSLEKSVFVSSESGLPPGEPIRIRLAGLLPGLSRWSHLAMDALPNELVDVSDAVVLGFVS
ncbi:hypothetical protein C0991_000303 [Blastosporella zonata]|nr:hypothetical protein C0991_000303 [Blastosporella zonata]